jgi:Tfp pilus assembly protein PilV
MLRGLRGSRGSAQPLQGEAGFALIEVMVSAVLLVVLALATIPLIDQSSKSASSNRQRGVATSLATADQDAMRQSPAATLANYHVTTTKLVNGITYTIKSDAEWLRDGSGLVTCSGNTARSEYAKITSKVTWPTMGNIKPIVVESYLTPGVAALQRGAVAVKLTGDGAVGTAGIAVTDTMPTAGALGGTTDAGGCVIIANVEQGANTISYSAAGYVDPNGSQAVTKSISVATGSTAQISGAYDQAASVTANFVDDAGTACTTTMCAWPSVSFYNAGITSPTNATRTFTNAAGAATSVSATSLYPFVSAYGVYAGRCTGNSPATYNATAPLASVTPAAGTNTSTAAPVLQRFRIAAVSSAGAPMANLAVSIAPSAGAAPMAGCESRLRAATQSAGQVTNAAGVLDLALPYGVWSVCLDNGTRKVSFTANNTPAGSATYPTDKIPTTTITGEAVVFPTISPYTGAVTGQCA